jgi:hypothetical protein
MTSATEARTSAEGNGLLHLFDAQRTTQINHYIDFGFHKELGMTEEAYRRDFPPVPAWPKGYKAGQDLLLYVDPRIFSVGKNLLLMRVGVDGKMRIPGDAIVDINEKIPKNPYAIWARRPSASVSSELDESQYRPATIREVVALSVFHSFAHSPDLFLAAKGSRWTRRTRTVQPSEIPVVHMSTSGVRTMGAQQPGGSALPVLVRV